MEQRIAYMVSESIPLGKSARVMLGDSAGSSVVIDKLKSVMDIGSGMILFRGESDEAIIPADRIVVVVAA